MTPAHAYALWQQGRNESSDNATAVSAEQIAAWLAIPLDGVVEGSGWNWYARGVLAVMTVVTAWGLGELVAVHAYALVGVVAVAYAVLLAAAIWAPRAWFRADAHGLTLRDAEGRRGRVTWRDEALASPQADGHLVHTSKGSFFLRHGTSNLGRLLAAIRELVQARNAGAVLPREDGLASDAALSRAVAATAGAERGLSRGA